MILGLLSGNGSVSFQLWIPHYGYRIFSLLLLLLLLLLVVVVVVVVVVGMLSLF